MAKWPYNTTAWQKLRRAKLNAEPACEDCGSFGRITVASHVDHRVAVSQGGEPFPGLDGLASLCASCHSAKTARGAEAGAVRTSKPRKGCSPDGTPLDPHHPWSPAGKSLRAERVGPMVESSFQLVGVERDG